MSVCQQAKRRRRQAKLDRRYRVRNAESSADKLRRQLAEEAQRKARKAMRAVGSKA